MFLLAANVVAIVIPVVLLLILIAVAFAVLPIMFWFIALVSGV